MSARRLPLHQMCASAFSPSAAVSCALTSPLRSARDGCAWRKKVSTGGKPAFTAQRLRLVQAAIIAEEFGREREGSAEVTRSCYCDYYCYNHHLYSCYCGLCNYCCCRRDSYCFLGNCCYRLCIHLSRYYSIVNTTTNSY